MKKINNNNKFRGNAVYSLNYKFDSVSPAGKCSGTALDLIKRYNELAKEAQNNGDYVGMEVFRQYAEHYRKIVTEINERKYQSREQQSANNAPSENGESAPVADNGLVETESAAPAPSAPVEPTENTPTAPAEKPQMRRRRNFTVVEVSEPEKAPEESAAETESKPRRRPYTRRNKATAEAAEA
ncbi:MAG: DUF4167 domain-containing protein [Alphaproteobacteria bacterium]|nr:DUF4167 domain-containing protein [Alphaproteobacteria bacterium]